MKNTCVLTTVFILLLSASASMGQAPPLVFMDLDFQTIEELGKAGGTVIVPMVQIESHGLHLPVGTDYYCAVEIARWTARKCGALVGVPITFGNCVPFSSWPGYIMIDTPTLNALVKQYIGSLQAQGFKKIIFIIMHGGDNFFGIKLAVDEYHKADPNVCTAITYAGMLLDRENYKVMQKGVDIDTSIMLYAKPELVHLEKLEKARPNRPQPKTKGRAVRYEQGKDLAYFRPDNYQEARNSTAELGKRFLEIFSDNLAEIIRDMSGVDR